MSVLTAVVLVGSAVIVASPSDCADMWKHHADSLHPRIATLSRVNLPFRLSLYRISLRYGETGRCFPPHAQAFRRSNPLPLPESTDGTG